MPWTVEVGDEFAPEFDQLHEEVRIEILALSRLLQQFGPQLGRPRVDTLKGSRHANMKELRFSAADGEWRVAFAFDPKAESNFAGSGRQVRRERKEVLQAAHYESGRAFRCASESNARERKEVTMPRNVNDIIRNLPARQRKKVEARAAQLIAEEMTLRQLRQACRLTQQKVAKSLRIGQEGVSKIERRSDLLISTLRDYVQAMGGQLSLVVEFPDREPVVLSGIPEFER